MRAPTPAADLPCTQDHSPRRIRAAAPADDLTDEASGIRREAGRFASALRRICHGSRMQLSPWSCRTRCNSKAANTEDACTSAPPWWNLRAGNGHGHGDQVPARGSHPGERARTSDVPSRLANSVTRAARASRAGSGPGSA
jgi:hypothetical protein